MRTRLIITKSADNIYVDTEVEVQSDVWILARKQTFLRDHIHPQTFEVLDNYIDIYVDGMGDFFIDQSENKNESLIVKDVQGVDTSQMDNSGLWFELQKL